MHQEYSEALHLFTYVVGDTERLDIWCETVYSCSQGARRWFGGGSCLESVTPGLSVDSKQCREQFVTPLSCFPQSSCNSLAFQTPVLLRVLLDLDTYGGLDPLGVFPLFLKMVADIIAPKFKYNFSWANPSLIDSRVLDSRVLAAIPKGAPST